MDIKFYNEEHQKAFYSICKRMKHLDCYHFSLAYLLSLDKVLREHTDEVFDFKEDCYDDGETYTNKDGYETELPSSYYTPDQIFCCKDYAPNYWQAIRIRFELN